MLFTQERTRTRQMFRGTWKKKQLDQNLEPLEKQIVSGDPYYSCFVLDPDGNKLEATFWDLSKVESKDD